MRRQRRRSSEYLYTGRLSNSDFKVVFNFSRGLGFIIMKTNTDEHFGFDAVSNGCSRVSFACSGVIYVLMVSQSVAVHPGAAAVS